MNTVSLFTGVGGLDYGFEAAGFQTRVAVEIDTECCQTLGINRNWPIINKDIHDTSTQEILFAGGLRRGGVDLLLGGPPCQPFSKSGYWVNGNTQRLDDPRADTLYAYMRCVDEMLPKVFFLENVHGINYSGKEEGFVLLQNLTKGINKRHGTNYQLNWKVLNVADYGVPQLRKRFLLVAHREGRTFHFPQPTHRAFLDSNDLGEDFIEGIQQEDINMTLPFHVTAWDAIGGLPITSHKELMLSGKWADLIPSIPEGENYLWHTNRKGGLSLFGWRTRYWNFLLKLAKNRPAWTVVAQPGPATGPFHWQNRLLCIRELASLQTLPKDLIMTGNRKLAQLQIGNAVPSLMGEILARAIAKQFFNVSFETPLKLEVTLRRPIPAPEISLPVSQNYLHLVRDYNDHPGTGKGPGVQKNKRIQASNADKTPEENSVLKRRERRAQQDNLSPTLL